MLLAVAVSAAASTALPNQAQGGLFCCHRPWCGGCAPCYWGCGSPHGCGHHHHCGILGWLFCHHRWNCGGCGYGWCNGCSVVCDGCTWSNAGCDNCTIGEGTSGSEYESYEGVPSGERVIYDGPAAGAPRMQAPTPIDSVRAPRPLHRLTSYARAGAGAYERGLSLYREGRGFEAAEQFEAAAQAEPDNALYLYHRALVEHDMYGADAAANALADAVAAEKRQPVANWGQQMERVQGPGRLWIEKARREAGVTR